jgi:diadenosine tetraphosphate (Ap4A) HIT family hydrolase
MNVTPSERLEALAEGRNPQLILRLPSGFAVMADNQYLPGYCLLLAYPQADQLSELSEKQRVLFLEDMATLGEAVQLVTECKRVNYGIYGNVDPFLHAHVWPRYEWEVPELITLPPLAFPEEIKCHIDTWYDPDIHFDTQERLRMALLSILERRGHIEVLP